MTTTTISTGLETGLAALAFSRHILDGFLSDFPEEKLTYQPFPGANHVLWNAGHLALTDDFFLIQLGGKQAQCPESWNELFWMGSTPIDEPGKYPSLAEIQKALQDNRAALVKWFKAMTPEELTEPLPDDYEGFASDRCKLISTIACHETMHTGQISVIRNALKLKRQFG